MRFRYFLALITALALHIWQNQPTLAHEGHDHGTEGISVSLPAAPRAEASSDAFELVAVARSNEIILYLDGFATNEPVSDTNVVVETPQGSVDAKREADGTYHLPAPWAASPGRYDLIATVTKDGNADVLAFTIEIPSTTPDALSTALSGPTPVSGIKGGILPREPGAWFALAAAFVLGSLAGTFLVRRRHAAPIVIAAALLPLFTLGAFAHDGEDHSVSQNSRSVGTGDVAHMLADGSVFVPKKTQHILAIRTLVAESTVYRRTVELPGRIIPDPNASGFVQAVVGGRLSPPEGGFPRLGTRVKQGDVLAYVTPPLQAIDISDMRQRQGELNQQISIVERRLARYATLAPSGAVARSLLEETELELRGLRERRAALDKVRRDPEPLVAPVDGIVADGTPVAGQVAQTNAVVFHIIDPVWLWVEALSYESLPSLQSATAQAGDKELKLIFRGAGFADRNQSIPIHFAINGDVSGIRVGQFVTVFADSPPEQRGLVVPRASVVRSAAGQDLIYAHVSAERFEQRPVRIEPIDGQRVLISQGLSAGTRIVVQGAELIDHIR
jgi:hypothetical protein